MRSVTTERFRKAFAGLPAQVQRQARSAYRQFQADPAHPGLHFKPIQGSPTLYSARVGLGYRALGTRDGDTIIWFWIGSHADYDRLIGMR